MGKTSLSQYMKIGERLRAARENEQITQRELSFRAGIPYTTYSNYENGNRAPDVETLQKICLVLGISLGSLLGYPDDIAESIAMQTPKDQVELDESGRAKFYYDPADEQAEAHFNKYKALNRAGRAQVDSYTDYIASNPDNLKAPDEEE